MGTTDKRAYRAYQAPYVYSEVLIPELVDSKSLYQSIKAGRPITVAIARKRFCWYTYPRQHCHTTRVDSLTAGVSREPGLRDIFTSCYTTWRHWYCKCALYVF